MPGEITPIISDKACAFPPGLFHHAKVFNGMVYTSGQIGADVSGKLVSDSVTDQTRQMITNLGAILEAAGSDLTRVIKINIFLVNSGDYAAMNEVYKEMIPDPRPPRTCVFVAGLPGGAKVEMEMVAAQK